MVQAVEVMYKPDQKWKWLLQHIVEFTSGGSVLIFVTKKTNSEELAKNLKENGHPCEYVSFTHSFIHLLVNSFIHSLIYFIHFSLCIYCGFLLICSIIRTFTHSFIHSFILSFIQTHPFIHSLISLLILMGILVLVIA